MFWVATLTSLRTGVITPDKSGRQNTAGPIRIRNTIRMMSIASEVQLGNGFLGRRDQEKAVLSVPSDVVTSTCLIMD